MFFILIFFLIAYPTRQAVQSMGSTSHRQLPQKVMFHYDGTYATYGKIDSINALSRGMFQMVKKWTDSEGYIWYNIIMNDPKKGKKYKLARVSENGRKLEFVCNKDNYPTAINPDEDSYCNYMRASMDYQKLP